MPDIAHPSIAVIIDRSYSMAPGIWPGQPAYLPFAQTDAATFVNIMKTGDYLGVVAFNHSAAAIFPATGPAVQITEQPTKDQATAAIQALTAAGTTDINAAIGAGMGLINNVNSGAPKGMVLLSDGDANAGVTNPDQMTVPNFPLYTIALGNHGQLHTLQVLAQRTGGQSYISPSPFDLMEVYNEIVQQVSVAATLANEKQLVSPNSFKITSASFPAGTPNGTFAVTWGNSAVSYTPNTPTGNQINVSIRDPNGKAVAVTAAAVGPGYVVFQVPNPLQGTYQAACWYSGANTLSTTTGIFNPDMSMTLKAALAEPAVAAGQPLRFTAEVEEDGRAVPGTRIDVSLRYPLISSETALLAHRDRLERIGAELAEQAGGEVSDNAKVWALQSRLGPAEQLQPYGERPVEIRSRGTKYQGACPTSATGGHLLYLRATGVSPHSGRPFSLTRCLSALAR